MKQNEPQLLENAKEAIVKDMNARGIGAIIWDLSTAGFHYIPEITVGDGDKSRTVRITGLYSYDGTLYMIEEDKGDISVDQFYKPGIEAQPTVVTLTPGSALDNIGNPENKPGYVSGGSLEEWLVIADCYFEALAEQ